MASWDQLVKSVEHEGEEHLPVDDILEADFTPEAVVDVVEDNQQENSNDAPDAFDEIEDQESALIRSELNQFLSVLEEEISDPIEFLHNPFEFDLSDNEEEQEEEDKENLHHSN